MEKICTVAECDRRVYAIGQCNMHYLRYRKYGSFDHPLGNIEQRFWSRVDKSGSCWVWTSTKNFGGYGVYSYNRQNFMAHRYSYQTKVGPIPEGMVIDHMCFNHACVNPAHLRACEQKQNLENREGLNRNNTSGVRGVSWDITRQRWSASIIHKRRRIFVGRYDSIEEAEAAVIAKRLEIFTHNDIDRAA